jgi:hypothetical protein
MDATTMKCRIFKATRDTRQEDTHRNKEESTHLLDTNNLKTPTIQL